MDNFITFNNSTIVTGVTSNEYFLVTEINEKQVGLQLFDFTPGSTNPPMDFIEMYDADLELYDVSLVDTGISYGAGVATMVNTSAYAMPIWKLEQDSTHEQSVEFQQATIVSQLTSTGTYVAVKIDNKGYGVPLHEYSTEYPFTSTVEMSAIDIKTSIVRPTNNMSDSTPSTSLNSKIKTYKDLIERIKYQLGAPFVNIEICEDTQIVDFIDKSLEFYTKYAGMTEEYLVFGSWLYEEPGLKIDDLFSLTAGMRTTDFESGSACWDYDLGEYRKVSGIFAFEQGETTGINTLFTLEQAMAQQTYFSYMLGNVGFDLVTWECMKGWLDLREKVLAQTPYIDFDEDTQRLRIIPAPNNNSQFYGVVGCWVEKPIKHLIKERWIEHYAMALTKLAVGNTRGKYQSLQLFGGGTINYNDLLSQGLEEKKALEAELMDGYGEVTPARFFIG